MGPDGGSVQGIPTRGDRALRGDAVGPVLDARPRPRRLHAAEQRCEHAQRLVGDARVRSRLAPGEARDHGRVRNPEHRHRGGLPRHRAQRTQGDDPVSEAPGQPVSPLEGARLEQHPLRLPDVGTPRDRSEPRGRVRRRDRPDEARRSTRDPLRLRRRLRDGAQPLLCASDHRSSAHRLWQGRPDPRLPQHRGHPAVRRARGAASGRPRRVPSVQPVHGAVLGARAGRDRATSRQGARAQRERSSRSRTPGSSSRSTTTTPSTRSSWTSGWSRTSSRRRSSARCSA